MQLSDMERRAVSGMQALEREMLERHAVERLGHQKDWLEMLAEIAETHNLPPDCWQNGYGIDISEWTIVRTHEGVEQMITEAA